MAAVRSAGNQSTELRLIALFRQLRITGWRRQYPLFGHPDFVFPKQKLAIFLDGCFWHACPLHGTIPKTRRTFWSKKLARNRARDQLVSRKLRAQGWHVSRIWEHALTPQYSALSTHHSVPSPRSSRLRRLLRNSPPT